MTKRKKNDERGQPGRFAYDGLDRVLHEKARLGIMTSLVTRPEGLLFGELKRLCALTDGNLSRHLDALMGSVVPPMTTKRGSSNCGKASRTGARKRSAGFQRKAVSVSWHISRSSSTSSATRCRRPHGAARRCRNCLQAGNRPESYTTRQLPSSNTTRPSSRSFFRCASALSSAAGSSAGGRKA